jgi:cellobiose phosphorylase
LSDQHTDGLVIPAARGFRTKYGYFSEGGKEYIITSPRTPRPWINVISNGDYGMAVSQSGSGYSWRTHAQLNRLTRWEQDLIKDEWGKYIYLRDERGNVWSAGWKPVCAEPDSYRCRHGIGYTVIESTNCGVETELLLFVPRGEPLEIWQLTLRNRSRRPRTLSLYTYFEWGLGQAPDWHREFHKSFIETEFDTSSHSILAGKRLWEVPTKRGHWNTDWPYVAFHSSNLLPVSYDTDKESFLGMYGSQALPASVGKKKLARHTGKWVDPCGSLHHVMRLKPNEEATIIYTLGCAESRSEAAALVARYRSREAVQEAFTKVSEQWAGLLKTVYVETPDPSMDLMENIWLKYQAISCRMWGRSAYYQTGGAYGFRDQLQDSQLWLSIDPERTKQQLLLQARHQFADGTVYHWWHPITEIGLRNRISDNLLWMPYVLNGYLQESADESILDIQERCTDDPQPITMYEHCTRAIDKALERFGERGLPLIGEGDWNDGLSAVGLDMKGESVWLGHFLYGILTDFSVIARRRHDDEHAALYAARAKQLRDALNIRGWDGEYYFGATKDSGELLGSHRDAEGAVWLNPQTWAVIAGVADTKRANQVFDVVEKKLETEIGPLLLSPAYSHPDEYIGYLTRYSPGMRENGGVYTHAATWAIAAACKAHDAELVGRLLTAINPAVKDPDRYWAEPYVLPGNVDGPDSPHHGRAGWTWYTGSAAWLHRVVCEWVLGVRPEWDGLRIDPCLPPGWDRARMVRPYRGCTYEISIERSDRLSEGAPEVTLDGARLKDNLIEAPCPAGAHHHVHVRCR